MIASSLARALASRTLANMLHTSARSWAPIVPVTFPRTSESINDGQIVDVSVRVGQKVEMDTPLLAIATDKVAIDVRAEQAGIVSKIHVKPGDERAVGAVLLEIDTDPAAVGASANTPSTTPAPTPVAAASTIAAPTHAVAAPTSTHSTTALVRKPSIQFRYGKRESSSRPDAGNAGAQAAMLPTAFVGNYNDYLNKLMPSKAKKSYLELPPLFGRPPLSPAEMAAVESGGAY